MINTGLDKKFVAKPDSEDQPSKRSYEPIPSGNYTVKVLEIQPWEKQIKDIYVNLRDNSGKVIKDATGKNQKELIKDVEYYNSLMTLEVQGGEHAGRRLFTNLTTHPNASFITDNFLYAINEREMIASDIPKKAPDRFLDVTVEIASYNKTQVDPDTGIETVEVRTKNEVKAFKKASLVKTVDNEDLF